jgi:hypothetical protein
VGEGIGGEKIAEFIMDDWRWNRLPGKNGYSCEHTRESNPDEDRAFFSGDCNRPGLDRAKPTIAHQRPDPAHQAQDHYAQANDKRHEPSLKRFASDRL